MLIDWFTVIAQAVNFIILVWLLKRFLYKPILHAIDEREKGITEKRAEAENDSAKAKKAHADFQEKNSIFDKQRNDLLKKAADDAQDERERLVEEARNVAASLRAKAQAALKSELKSINKEIIDRTQREVFVIARKTLKDLADVGLEKRICEEFVRRIKDREPLLENAAGEAMVRSAFDLALEQRKAIEDAVKEKYSSTSGVKFEVEEDLIGGIELTVNGHKIAWSIADYLDAVVKNVAEVLDGTLASELDPRSELKSKAHASSDPALNPNLVLESDQPDSAVV